ncbi:MAG: hypothetical protein MUF61_02415 [archaeon]|nr:hypothetical protein [archaeon]
MSEDLSENRILDYFSAQSARQYEIGAFDDGFDEDSGFGEVTKEVCGDLRNLSEKYLKVWSNKDAEHIMIRLESTLKKYGLSRADDEPQE